MSKVWHSLGIVYTLMFLFVAGTLFRAETLSDVWSLLSTMLPWTAISGCNHELTQMFWQSTVPISLLTYGVYLTVRSNLVFIQQIPVIGLKQLMVLWQNSAPVRYVSYALYWIAYFRICAK